MVDPHVGQAYCDGFSKTQFNIEVRVAKIYFVFFLLIVFLLFFFFIVGLVVLVYYTPVVCGVGGHLMF